MPSCNTYHLTWVSLTLGGGISSWLLQQSAAAAPYLGWGVSPYCRPSWPWTWSGSSQPSCKGLRRNLVDILVNKRVENVVPGCNLKNDRMISVHFQGKPFSIAVIQVCAPTTNAEETKVEWFHEDQQDLLELASKNKDFLFITGYWNAKVGSQEIPGVTGKFGLEVQNEVGQRLREFCQENAVVIAPSSNNTREDSTHGHP